MKNCKTLLIINKIISTKNIDCTSKKIYTFGD